MSFQLMLPAPMEARHVSQDTGRGETEAQLSQEQSLCLVKVFINASLGCICFARGLIPSDSPTYQDRRVDDLLLIHLTSSLASYHSFLSYQSQLSVDNESQLFKILVGGKDKRADQILNLVENGVFDAVDRGYLEAVQFTLCRDSSRRQETIERYTFSFTYAEFEGSGRKVCGVKVSPTTGDHFHVAGAQKSFRRAIRNLLVLCQQLPALPRRRSLGVSLLYNPTCPHLYEPPGFARLPETDTLSFIGTSIVTDNLGRFQVGSYEVAVAASHAKLASEEAIGRLQVPRTIKDDYSTRYSTRHSTRYPTGSYLEDLTTRRQLQAMQQSSSVPSNLISTQVERTLKTSQLATEPVPRPALHAATPSKRDSRMGADWYPRGQRNIAPAKMAELIVQAWGIEMHNRSLIYVLDMDHLRNNKIKRLSPGRDINCECRSNHEEDAMTLCELCGLWQHDICYGLQKYRPQEKPNEHFCYSCLLLPRAEVVNEEMPAVVRMRLALTHIQNYEVQVIEKDSLMKAVHLAADDQTAYQELVARLQHEGFIQKSSKNGSFAVVTEGRKVTDARSDYIDPLARISDYYVIVKDKETAQDRANAIREALNQYADSRSFDLGPDEPELDEWLCEDSSGRQITRWGFYPDANNMPRQSKGRKRMSSPNPSPEAKKPRKMSISKTVVNLDFPMDASSDIETDVISTNDSTSTR